MSISNSQRSFGFAALSAVVMAVCAVAYSAVTSMEVSRETAAISMVATDQEHGMTLEQAVAMVEAKYKARALRYNTVEEDGHSIHYIRLITADHSRVFTVRVDATTGQELPQ
jgi:uncharacterized membrane protein YkoI